VALTKVIRALRQRGITVYNFSPSNETCEGIDFTFFKYATAHRQANTTNNAYLPGLPVFTGHADTLAHFASGLLVVDTEALMPIQEEQRCVPIKRILGAVIRYSLRMDNRVSRHENLAASAIRRI
jgi:hypothetical protein